VLFGSLLEPAAASAASFSPDALRLQVEGSCVDEDQLRQALQAEWALRASDRPEVLVRCGQGALTVHLSREGKRSQQYYPMESLPSQAKERGLALLIVESVAPDFDTPPEPPPRRSDAVAPESQETDSDDAARLAPGVSVDQDESSAGVEEELYLDENEEEERGALLDPSDPESLASENQDEVARYALELEDVRQQQTWMPEATLFVGPLIRTYVSGGWLGGGSMMLSCGHLQLGVEIAGSSHRNVVSNDIGAAFGYAFLRETNRLLRPNFGLKTRVSYTHAGGEDSAYLGGGLFGQVDLVFSKMFRVRLNTEFGHGGVTDSEKLGRVQGLYMATALTFGATGRTNGEP
jgi:hypothetical protein